ncbi:maleylpyruvate isomerase family mycothiol-dependent enzyme [Actinacidiphila acidipaludis]|uniref:Maleylpyruvate isomerase family mycothiol-dependent enzyme n=1 Tax=Actinacidiphila acidipaludis TaxID=2873382 RepID=A0ABS7QH50_9ACTN|nr:maleylpyruvate isomerase family mycothiol-dependent enzyme [Streptomyces acidipaludis]MBY8882500.1 maleylpyruvate isomerase family mycothiol-dependent enzyme [Streptomyces acidipaludis]
MKTDAFIGTLRREGRLLAEAAERSGLDAPVPPCPDWQVRDLLRHTGAVHRWAAAFVAEQRTADVEWDETAPEDPLLVAWYRDLHSDLVGTLDTAPPDVACWTFLPAPSPLAFWARRQAHETTIHRVDAEAALGGVLTPVDAEFAADGVDELLSGFHVRRRSRVRTDRPRTLRVVATDSPGGDWLLHLSPEPPVVERGVTGAADCTLGGPADALYLALWNRGPYDVLSVEGDDELVSLWRRTSAVI